VGESREGGGSIRQDATDKVARTVVLDALKSGRELSQLTVQRVTEGVYTVELYIHGEPEPERYMYAERDLADPKAGSHPPSGERMRSDNG
jgi:hypothetical protein